MAQVRVLILRAPGTNCDQETAFAFGQAGADTEIIHINRLLSEPTLADQYQILCLPGGFSYGDDIAAGRIVAGQIRHHLTEELQRFREDGKLILGICNGFQILLKSGILLPDEAGKSAPATLAWNESGYYQDRWVHVGTDSGSESKCVFLRDIERMYLPIAHAEGRFVTRDAGTFAALSTGGQLALRYTTANGATSNDALPFPDNPNGSQANVAGVCDSSGRVFGLMPHPERHIHPTQHPQWTRLPQREVGDGFKMFQNAVQYFR